MNKGWTSRSFLYPIAGDAFQLFTDYPKDLDATSCESLLPGYLSCVLPRVEPLNTNNLTTNTERCQQ